MADTPKLEGPQTEADELAGSEMPLLDHLIELRQRLIWSIATVGILCVVCFIFAKQLFDFLLGPYKAAVPNLKDVHLIYTAPQEFFFTQLSVALFAAMMRMCRPEHEGADFTLQASAQLLLSGFVGASSGVLAKALGYEDLFLGAGMLGLLVLGMVLLHRRSVKLQ